MDIIVKRRQPGSPVQQTQKLAQPSPYDKRYGEWGSVKELHSEDNTVDIILETGNLLKRVPVKSDEWVVSGEDAEKDYNSGERDLPPEHARVFVMMPTGTYNDCFVLCSGFSTIDQTKPFMDDDKERIKERFMPNRWHIIDDYITGRHKIISPDEKTSLEIDYGEEELKEVPELHIQLFENIKLDVISDTNMILTVKDFKNAEEQIAKVTINDDQIETKYKEKSTVLQDEDHIKAYTEKCSLDMKGEKIEATNGKDTIRANAGDVDVISPKPIGINGGGTNLKETSLSPYWLAEKTAFTAVQTYSDPSKNVPLTIQLAIADAMTGGLGQLVALGPILFALSSAQIAADEDVEKTAAKIIK